MNTSKTNYELTVPYEGDPIDAAKEYNLEIKKQKRNIDSSFDVTFIGKKVDLLRLLDEFGGDENNNYYLDAPYGIIKECIA